MAASTQAKSGDSVAEIFESMSYGPAPESPEAAKKWLEDHSNGNLGHFINNQWMRPEGRKAYETRYPATGEVMASTVQGTQEDVDTAVAAAKTAFGSWSKLSGHVRARHLYSIARHVQKHQRLISVIEAMDNGKTIRETRDCDIPLVVRHFYHHAGWAELMDTEMQNWKPIGVVGGIVPWNFPLMLLTWKICPALAMGNTVVLKPATYTRLSALLLAEICAEAGLPPGVFNVVTGPGSFGSLLAMHPDVDKVAFTGSTQVGQLLRRATAGTGKKISLELGGKSPIVVFDSADLDSTVEGIVDAIWFNQGQVCSAGSRLLVQETVYETVISKLKERLTHFRVSDTLDKSGDMAALVDESQRKTVEQYVEEARKQGAEIFQPSAPLPTKGCYYPPTLITKVSSVSKVMDEEIFGPVLCAMPFRTAKEGLALGNNTRYGLGASVWTENLPLALEAAMTLKAGSVWINCHNQFDAAAGFGGYRESGYGRDGGKEGLFEYVQPKWHNRAYPKVDPKFDLKKFGTSVMGLPTLDNQASMVNISGMLTPAVDHTYKLYYGGKQARPDQAHSRPVVNNSGKVITHVADGNRKDVRNAVEAAFKAAPGWGKRAAFNRSQIVYYMAENLELRREEFAAKLANGTGCSLDDATREVDLSVQRLFYWGALADKYGGTVQVFDTSDLPGGVVNILTGNRDHLTKYITEHQNVQAMWYFGSAEGAKFVETMSAENLKRTWVSYGETRDWSNPAQGQGEEFLYHACQVKNIWVPMGDVFAN
ncbi:PREDICTED: aldehyde dehydrogenase-like isoform X2 [Priapulus caudatus]|uniref:Aldehyde dehydrogenase-like isoform X2 n=1 Tax=Priapulus caudatus TaxID=37621 RepID=A0ABM1F098_PRICU|nr:PREDICTED: aldehyde dehydrogenase-like isoform X2 [Priapulus caudatus]